MSYRLENRNPYDNKKISFGKTIVSTFMTLLMCGVVTIVSSRIVSLHIIQKATEEHANTISYYDKMVEETAQFMKENTSCPEECFKLYTVLLWKGYFSENQNYQYSTEKGNDIIGNFGARIVTGEGNCKNNADFFYKIMKKMGYQTYQVVCILQMDGSDLEFQEYLYGNHVITVVEYNGEEYYFDPTNFCAYQKKEHGYVNEEKHLKLILRPIISYICGYNTEIDTMDLMLDELKSNSGFSFVVDGSYEINKEKALELKKSIKPFLTEISHSMNRKETI